MRLKNSWITYFEEKIFTDHGINARELSDYQQAAAPLIYCCLENRRISTKKRKVILSESLACGPWVADNRWKKLADDIENGNEINKYLSKSIGNWRAIDSLLFVYGISHLHLKKSSKGGIGRELAFGIFNDNSFYAIHIGDHEDLYRHSKLLEIVRQNWPDLLRQNSSTVNEGTTYPSDEEFRMYANHPSFQFNLLSPSAGKSGSQSFSLLGHQHTQLISFEIDNIEYKKIPLKAYCAYRNELKYITTIGTLLHNARPEINPTIAIDRQNKQYVITSESDESFCYIAPIPTDRVLCSTYGESIG